MNAATTTLEASTSTAEDISSLPKVLIQAYTIRLLKLGPGSHASADVNGAVAGPVAATAHGGGGRAVEAGDAAAEAAEAGRGEGAGEEAQERGGGRDGRPAGQDTCRKQDLGKLRTQKMKGLKAGRDDMLVDTEHDGPMLVGDEGGDNAEDGERRRRWAKTRPWARPTVRTHAQAGRERVRKAVIELYGGRGTRSPGDAPRTPQGGPGVWKGAGCTSEKDWAFRKTTPTAALLNRSHTPCATCLAAQPSALSQMALIGWREQRTLAVSDWLQVLPPRAAPSRLLT